MPTILYSSVNIARIIKEKYPQLVAHLRESEKDVIYVETNFDSDCIIIPSTHRSKDNLPALTAHICGNWNEAGLGGVPKTLNIAPATRLKAAMAAMKKEVEARGLDIQVTLEADHHGPTAKVPIMFVEVGSTEKEWDDPVLCEIAACAVKAAFEATGIDQATGRKCQAFLGVGGGHYSNAFTKIELDDLQALQALSKLGIFGHESGLAVSHLLPKYQIDGLDFEVFRQAIEKSVEPVELVLIEKDGVNAKQRDKIIEFCKQDGIRHYLI